MIHLPPDAPILVVDDNEADLMIIETVVERSNLDNPVELFRGAGDALERMEQVLEGDASFPVLMLVDVNMPRMNGFQLLEELRSREEFRKLPIVLMLSSSDAEGDRKKAERLGADDYLVKASGIQEYVDLLNASFSNGPSDDSQGPDGTVNSAVA